MKRRARGRSGFTVLEFAAATGCLAVLLGAAAVLALGIHKGVRQNEQETVALAVARGLLAELRARPDAPAGSETRPLPLPAETAGRLPEAAANVRWEAWEPGLSKATVVLSWKGARGGPRKIELVTLVEQGGTR
ncbi:MAG: hypothetical protein MUC63_04045 [Planctomycetes bacterium]|jgi:type II secretory pathway pseudopilin PulG|nr:hypothetical protein [Planctomycetota bacterium]MCU0727931.1 hypothetical protein [Planctomycetota bacterium]